MPSFKTARAAILSSRNLDSDDLRAIAISCTNLTQAKAITSVSAATPGVVTSNSHGFSDGDEVMIVGVGGVAAANGHFIVAGATTNTFELTDPITGADVATSGTYTSGGWIIPLGAAGLDNLNDVASGARAAVTGTLANTSVTNGIFDADDDVFTSVPAGDPIDLLFIYYHTGTESTSLLLYALASDDLPITPDGNNIDLNWDNGANKIFRMVN